MQEATLVSRRLFPGGSFLLAHGAGHNSPEGQNWIATETCAQRTISTHPRTHSRSVDGLDEGPGPASVLGHSRRTRRCLSSREAPASPPRVGPVRVAMVTPASIHFLTQGPCTARTAFGPTNGHWLWSQVPGLGGHQEGASQACEGHRPCIYPAPAVTRQSPAPSTGVPAPTFLIMNDQ